jgi:nucleotide-binding universal stress UspA family protein
MKILVAFDPSAESARVLQWARAFRDQFAKPPRLTLLHVVPIATEGEIGVQDQIAALDLGQARETVQRLAPASEFEVRLLAGHPGRIICEEAADFDMIVIGSRGRSPLSELLLGSVGSYVVHNAPCAVLVVGPNASAPRA